MITCIYTLIFKKKCIKCMKLHVITTRYIDPIKSNEREEMAIQLRIHVMALMEKMIEEKLFL